MAASSPGSTPCNIPKSGETDGELNSFEIIDDHFCHPQDDSFITRLCSDG